MEFDHTSTGFWLILPREVGDFLVISFSFYFIGYTVHGTVQYSTGIIVIIIISIFTFHSFIHTAVLLYYASTRTCIIYTAVHYIILIFVLIY